MALSWHQLARDPQPKEVYQGKFWLDSTTDMYTVSGHVLNMCLYIGDLCVVLIALLINKLETREVMLQSGFPVLMVVVLWLTVWHIICNIISSKA